MDLLVRDDIDRKIALGRQIWCAMGEGAALEDSIRCGFTRFSLAEGKMIPHAHEREVILVLDAKGCTARFGPAKEKLENATRLKAGDLLRFHDGEWHVFDMDGDDSYLDIFFVFSVPMNHVTE